MAPRPVLLVCDHPPGRGGATPLAAGGIAAAVGPDDTAILHAEDTLRAGHCNNHEAVHRLTQDAIDAVAWLTALGVSFDCDNHGVFELGLEGGHCRHRILHAGGDATGAMIATRLAEALQSTPSVRVLSGLSVDGIRVSANGHVCGVHAMDGDGGCHIVDGAAVLLACGGVSGLFAERTGPADLQGLALSVGLTVGAQLRDLPYLQFHPTVLAVDAPRGDGRRALVTEALRGAGAVLRDREGRRLMAGHPLADLAPRDLVARAVAAAEAPWLDTTACAADWPQSFPSTVALLAEHGIRPGQPIPVCAAQHYHMGGLATDLDGASDVPGLFAIGECAVNGVHGANRLASNSLLEGVVFGRHVATVLGALAQRSRAASTLRLAPSADPSALAALRHLLSRVLGPQRSRQNLLDALPALARDSRQHSVARAMVLATLAARESRGAHCWDTTCQPAAVQSPITSRHIAAR